MTQQHNQDQAAQEPLILSLGSINADFQIRIEEQPDTGDTIEGRDFRRFSGGKGANVSFFARRLGIATKLLGCVGDDDLSEQALKPLQRAGVDLSGVQRLTAKSTGVAMITVPSNGKKNVALAKNANAAWPTYAVEEVVRTIHEAPSTAILVLDGEIPSDILEQAAIAANEHGIRVVLDPSPAADITEALIAMADFITPNPMEAKQLTNINCDDVDAAAGAGDNLIERGAGVACMKLADGGCVLVKAQECIHVKSPAAKVIDTTGAGDAFAGALAVALAEQRSTIDATSFAVAASHLTVMAYGAQAALPNRDQIEELIGLLSVQQNALYSH